MLSQAVQKLRSTFVRLRGANWQVIGGWVRRVAAALALCGAIAVLLVSVHRHYPVQRWLFWAYGQYWLMALAFSVTCTSAGFLALRGLRLRLPLAERLLLSMATGVLLWFLAMFVGGLFGLYSRTFAIAMPVMLAAVGSVPLFGYLRRAWRHLRAARRRAPVRSVWHTLAMAGGFLGLVMVYLNILTPENVAYDSRWYHLSLAEHYADAGGVSRFPEGWFQGTLPQLTSFIYIWPYLFPKIPLFGQVMVSAHLEFILFLWTLAGIPVLVRWLVPGARVFASWAAFFLFSAIFVYDSTLSVAADHVAAFWAIPIFLTLRRAWGALEPRACLLLAAMLAAATLTKYQSASLLVFPFAAIGLRSVWLLGARLRNRLRPPSVPVGASLPVWPVWPILGPLVLTLVFCALTAPHWLKNWIWYGDPLYPVLHKHLTLRPWHEDSQHLYKTLVDRHFWRPKGTPIEKLKQTATALFTFSFKPHDWPKFHRDWPVFGFLFTLSLFAMPFIRAGRRVWALLLAGHVGLLVWFLLSHQDRYLQIFVPWMVAHVAAVIALVWRLGWLPRVPLLALLGLQVVWGFGTYFIPAHVFTEYPIRRVIDLLASGYRGQHADRLRIWNEIAEVGKAVSPGGKVLLHRFEMHAGLRRMAVMDHPSWNALFNYNRMKSPAEAHALMRSVGVTQVAWLEEDWLKEDSLAADLRFIGVLSHVVKNERTAGGIHYADLPAAPPRPGLRENVLYMGCAGYQPGLYHLTDLTVPGMEPPPHIPYPAPRRTLSQTRMEFVDELADIADFIVLGDCPGNVLPTRIHQDFRRRAGRLTEQLYVRRLPVYETPEPARGSGK